jgi:formamidopyrimidine-DNA glycosylase
VPELPEVETIRRDLDAALRGRRIDRVTAGGRSLRRHGDPTSFARILVGATVQSVSRRGKYLVVSLHRDQDLVLHLGMSGQLLLATPEDPALRHTHVILGWNDPDGPRELRFVDPRTFGEVFIAQPGGPELSHLGVDPLVDVPDGAALAERLRARRTQLKALLMDQRFLAGIGNIYSDEILFAARLRYDRRSDTLTDDDVQQLHQAITGILTAAIAARGSSLADEQYRDLFGQIGGFQRQHQVYGREGEPCPRCGQPFVRIKTGGRSTFFCPRCQV